MSNKKFPPRSEFMKPADKKAMGTWPRTHQNCKEATGVYRPGKTARDRAMGNI